MKKRRKDTTKFLISYLLVIITLLFFVSSCGSNKTNNQKTSDYPTLKLEKASSDSTEYEIIIIDPGYENFLATQKPMNYYSQRYYENWNRYYVNDWNEKVRNSMYHTPKYQNVFDTYIDYDFHIDYGIEVNYKLYYYFRFVEKRYGVRFNVPRAIHY